MKKFLLITLLLGSLNAYTQWDLNGNDISPSNFLGVTGAGDELIFKTTTIGGTTNEYLRLTNKGLIYITNQGTGNHFVGYQSGLVNSNGTYNTAFGFQVLKANLTGAYNTGIGANALLSNVSGNFNLAVGYNALKSNTNGSYNLAIGYQALSNSTSSSNNLGIGSFSLYSNSTGSQNLSIGNSALYSNTTGSNNIAIGKAALSGNFTGGENIAIGVGALVLNNNSSFCIAIGNSALSSSNGNGNIAIGHEVLQSSTTAVGNTAVGYRALASLTTSSYNTAIGYEALLSVSSFGTHVAIGYGALRSTVSSFGSTALGYNALRNSTTGGNNTGIGEEVYVNCIAGNFNVGVGSDVGLATINGAQNTFIGYGSGSSSDFNNSGAFGYLATSTADNKIWLGNGANTIWSSISYNISDARFKEIIDESVPGLEFIMLLKPVKYKLKSKELDSYKLADNNQLKSSLDEIDYTKSEEIVHTGLLAQDVLESAKSIGFNFDGVAEPTNDNDVYGVNYSSFVMPLIVAVQEQQNMIDSLVKICNYLANQSGIVAPVSNNEIAFLSNLYIIEESFGNEILAVNPNPSKGEVSVLIKIANSFSDIEFVVYSSNGLQVYNSNSLVAGENVLNISTVDWISGSYYAVLIMNNTLIDSSRIIVF